MRAYIEYPEVGPGRIEITSEFSVRTPGFVVDDRAGLDQRMRDDIFDDGNRTVDGIEMEPKQDRYRGDDEYWKDEC